MIRVIDDHHLQVGDRTWWGHFESYDLEGVDYPWKRRQFIVHFESKWSVSIIWGYGTYSDNHDLPWYKPEQPFNETPETVEAAVFHADRDGIQGNDGDPFAYIDEYQLNALLTFISQLATDAVFEVLQLDRE